jgi:sRNA-binding protein
MPYKKIKKSSNKTIHKVSVEIKKIPKPNHIQRAKEFLTHLRKHFNVFQKNQPLMIGVDKELSTVFPDIPKRVINSALHLHTNSKKYLKNMSKGYNRVDLSGQFISVLDKVCIQKAKKNLSQLFKREEKH